MWQCPNCNNHNDADANFCGMCGTPRPAAPAGNSEGRTAPVMRQNEPAQPRPNASQRSNVAELRPNTPAPRPAVAPVPQPVNNYDPYDMVYEEPPKKKGKRWLIIVIAVVLVLAILAGAGVFLLESRYKQAGELYAQGAWGKAAEKYESIGWYRDSKARAVDCSEAENVAAAQLLFDLGDYMTARSMVAACKGEAAQALTERTYIAEARSLISKGDNAAAAIALEKAGSSPEAAELRMSLGSGTYVAGENDETAVEITAEPTEESTEEPAADATPSTEIGSLELSSLGGSLSMTAVTTQDQAEDELEAPLDELLDEAVSATSTVEPEVPQTNIGTGTALPADDGQDAYVGGPEQVVNAELTSTRIAAGSGHTIGLKRDGTVMSVGDNTYGQCDVGMWKNIVALSAGDLHSVGLRNDGTVVTAGSNDFYQCEVGEWHDIVDIAAGGHYTVGVMSDGRVVATGVNMFGQCDVSGWNGIRSVAAGYWHTVGVTDAGNVVAVGYNEYGQCDVGGWSNIVQLSAGRSHTVGLRADGTVVATGDNEFGQCDVSGWTDIIAVKAGVAYTIGLKSDGTLVAAGYDGEDGRCAVTDWSGVKAISVGGYHTIGVMDDGSLTATGWGNNGACDITGWNLN